MRQYLAPIRKFAGADLPPRTIVAVASDATLDRAGDVMVAGGCIYQAFKANPIVLRDHDPTKPIGRASIAIKGNVVEATITFAEPGISETADQTYALVKADVLNAVSIGFIGLESEPLPSGGRKFTSWELLEISVVSIPANPNAQIFRRSYLGVKSGREISAENQAHLDAMRASFSKAALCAEETNALLRERGKVLDEIRDRLSQFGELIEEAQARAAAMAGDKSQGARIKALTKRREDREDCDRRRRAIAGLRRSAADQDAYMWANFPAAPKSFRVINPARQLRAIITDERTNTRGKIVSVEGIDLRAYKERAAVCIDHDQSTVVAWCCGLDVGGGQIIATLQFPPAGKSAASDAAWADVVSGRRPAVSIGYAVEEKRTRADGVVVVTACELREISFVAEGANPAALIFEIAGKSVRRSADIPANPYGTGASAAHDAAAQRELWRRRAGLLFGK